MPALVSSERRTDGVAIVRLDRPPVNTLSRALLTELADVAQALALDTAVRAVVVCGEGQAFAAGADISEFDDQDTAREIGVRFRAAFDTLAAIPRPVIAAIHGVALGGGLELALACDLRVAADTARIGQPEILLGIIPGAGGTQRLARLVGPARAKDLIWSGRQVTADEALAMGLVDLVVPAADLLDVTLEHAGALAAGPTVALALAKRVIDAGLDGSLQHGLDLEAEAFVEVFGSEDAATGVRSFLERGPGKATFTGR
jgi:enoyl-CoA hydratase/carnithine racemase